MQIYFTKCHGSGNDFVLLENDLIAQTWTLEQIGNFAKDVCQRDSLIGADSLILIERGIQHDAKMTVYNADGSPAEMCGNALRCVARKLMECQPNLNSFQIKISDGTILNCWQDDMLADQIVTMGVEIGPASLDMAKWLPTLMQENETFLNQKVEMFHTSEVFSAVAIPNPHLIAFVEQIDQQKLSQWGEIVIENSEVFPYGMNVSMASLIEENTMFVLTYERGCGITAACGTAISSSCYVGTLNRFFSEGEKVTVHTLGGVAKCVIPSIEKGIVQFSGNATFEYHATLEYDHPSQTCLNLQILEEFQEEQIAFEHFLRQRPSAVLDILDKRL